MTGYTAPGDRGVGENRGHTPWHSNHSLLRALVMDGWMDVVFYHKLR